MEKLCDLTQTLPEMAAFKPLRTCAFVAESQSWPGVFTQE
jgi:hypothetical protein